MMMTADDLIAAALKVTKKWAKQRKREERESRARINRRYMFSGRVNQTDVAWDVIPNAYLKVSSDGTLPAHARQIMYAARGEIQARTGRPLEDAYFTQTLLPKFLNEHPELTANWKVVYDARGHLIEPHTEENIPLGTLDVDDYLRRVRQPKDRKLSLAFEDRRFPTCGPQHRYSAILFCEKEGFHPLFQATKLAERYDLAIMSTKGQSVVAARRLIDELCASNGGIPVLVLHDMDEAGFLISQTLTSVSAAAEEAGRIRYQFQNEINVIDLGLRLADVNAWNLQSESVRYKGILDSATIATPEELAFFKSGRRVELNAFISADFIAWIELKLKEYGITKVVPDGATLEAAFRRAYQIAEINRQVESVAKAAAKQAKLVGIPSDLTMRVRKSLAANPAKPWDEVLAEIASAPSSINGK